MELHLILAASFLALSGCGAVSACGPERSPDMAAEQTADERTDGFAAARAAMVAEQLRGRDITDDRVLEAMQRVPRHRLVPAAQQRHAYEDTPLPIGQNQTISQPYIVAYMTQALEVGPDDRVLEIGTGSGYQAAVLGELAKEVYTIEIVPELGERATRDLADLGYDNVHVRIGDGYQGWAEHAPYDAVIVTAAPDHVPQPLVDQLKVGGRMVIPVGSWYQELRVLTKTAEGLKEEATLPVRFVPMTGRAIK